MSDKMLQIMSPECAFEPQLYYISKRYCVLEMKRR